MDVVTLSRIQFALTIMFHYLFPPLTIGLGVIMVYLEIRFHLTKDRIYENAARFWTGIFALNFAIGVASGIAMEFQFGTNWAVYSRFVGDVFGSALAAEGLFAFFLESGFLAVLVFGWDRVSPKFHLLSTIMVALGSIFSAVWIIVANSWQQTPAGHHIVQMLRDGQPWFVDGKPIMRAEVVDFWSVVFNPSTVNRLVHTLIGAFILGAFVAMSISAFYILRKRHEEFARRSFSGALVLGTIASLAALVSGDFNAKMVARHQPAKLAAMEGHYQTGPGDLSLFGLPNDAEERLDYKVAVPGMLSFLVAGDTRAEVIGLDKFRPNERPSVLVSFASYHIMVGLGSLFILLTLFACYLRLRGTLFEKRWLMWIFVFAVTGPVIANELGWVTAEAGRQPWVVHPRVVRDAAGQIQYDTEGFVLYRRDEGLRTDQSTSEVVTSDQVLVSIVMFSVIYLLLVALWIYVFNHKIQKGPQPLTVPAGPSPESGFLNAASGRFAQKSSLTGTRDLNDHDDQTNN